MKLFKRKTSELGRHRIKRAEPTAHQAYSYHARRSEQTLNNTGRQTQRVALSDASKKFANFWLRRFGLFIFLVAVVVSTISILTLSTNPKIILLSSAGDQSFLQSTTTYQQAAGKLFASSIWNRNKITVDTDKISSQLSDQFPELSAVSITLPLVGHRPLVYIQPAEPAVIVEAANGTYLVDSQGKALQVATTPESNSLKLPVLVDPGLDAAINHEALTSNDVSFIQTVIAELGARHFYVTSFTLPPGTSELDAHLSNVTYFVKFNLENNDPLQQSGTFLAVQARLQSQNITLTKYIDVRIDGRAYYE